MSGVEPALTAMEAHTVLQYAFSDSVELHSRLESMDSVFVTTFRAMKAR